VICNKKVALLEVFNIQVERDHLLQSNFLRFWIFFHSTDAQSVDEWYQKFCHTKCIFFIYD